MTSTRLISENGKLFQCVLLGEFMIAAGSLIFVYDARCLDQNNQNKNVNLYTIEHMNEFRLSTMRDNKIAFLSAKEKRKNIHPSIVERFSPLRQTMMKRFELTHQ